MPALTPHEQRAAVEARLQRLQRPHPSAQARLQRLAQTWDDWQATCSRCKAPISGTMKQIKEHVCACSK